MLPKLINKNLNDMKFYIFEQAVYNKIEKTIEKCIKELNATQNKEEQIMKYRYGTEGRGMSSGRDFFIEFYYNKWTYESTPWGGSTYKPQIRIDTRILNGFQFSTKTTPVQENILFKYFGNDEMLLYAQMLSSIYDIRSNVGKDYEWTKNRHYYKNTWFNGY